MQKTSSHSPLVPVIGISGYNDASASIQAIIGCVQELGGTPLFLGNHQCRIAGCATEQAEKDYGELAGIIIMGNDEDIDPSRYGADLHPQTQIEQCAIRVEYEEAMIHLALEKKTPLLCICGGMQRLNVLGGGTLHQHLPDMLEHNRHNTRDQCPTLPVDRLHIHEGTRLHEIFETMKYTLAIDEEWDENNCWVLDNSLHHQAIDRVREDFHVTARAEDEVIEAIEPKPDSRYAGQFVLGVQWHPEYLASPLSIAIIAELIEQSRWQIRHRQT